MSLVEGYMGYLGNETLETRLAAYKPVYNWDSWIGNKVTSFWTFFGNNSIIGQCNRELSQFFAYNRTCSVIGQHNK